MSDKIPDLMKLGEIETDMAQVVTTDIIEPTVFSQSFCRFALDRRVGFLHSNSKITVSVTPKTNDISFFPLNIGCHSLIKNARLLIGQKEIQSVSDFGFLSGYQSEFVTNENNKERQRFVDGRSMAHKNTVEEGALSSNNYSLDVGMSQKKTAGGVDTKLPVFMIMDATKTAESPVYSIFLSQLFPMLRTFQLPAYMIDEPIFIEITWQDKLSNLSGANRSQLLCCDSAGDQGVEYDIDQNELKLIYDSITYDGSVMSKYRQNNSNITFQFSEYSLAKRTGDDSAFTGLKLNVGGNGRLCSRIIYGLQPDTSFEDRSLVNGYRGQAPTDGNNLTMNVMYNDRNIFSQDRSNSALLFSTTQQSEGAVPMVTRGEYTLNVDDISPNTLEGLGQLANLEGAFFWNSVRLNRSERVNNKGITLDYKNAGLTALATYTLRVWVESLKVATLKDGAFDCYFA